MTAGTEYYIAVGTSYGWNAGTFDLTCEAMTYNAPNDLCSAAQAITVGRTTFDNTGATNEQTSNFVTPYRDVWFKFPNTCTAGGFYVETEASPTGALRLTALILTSGCSAASECASTEQFSRGTMNYNQRVLMEGSSGQSYFIRIGTIAASDPPVTGAFTITCAATAGSDSVKDSKAITGNGLFTYNTTGTTSDYCTNDVWFTWTAPCTGLGWVTGCGTYSGGGVQPFVALLTLDRSSPSRPTSQLSSQLSFATSSARLKQSQLSFDQLEPSTLHSVHPRVNFNRLNFSHENCRDLD